MLLSCVSHGHNTMVYIIKIVRLQLQIKYMYNNDLEDSDFIKLAFLFI